MPFFERDPEAPHPAASHRPAPVTAPPPALPLARAIQLAATGFWVAKRSGALIAIGGQDHWDCRESLATAAAAAGVPLSDIAIRTGAIA